MEPVADLRVPTATFMAEVVLVGGEALRGQFPVPAQTSWHAGPVLPVERLNDEADFFPFLTEAGPVVVNKRQVAWVTFDLRMVPQTDEEIAVESSHLVPEQRVWVDVAGRRLDGVLFMDLPGYKNRVLDYLNEPSRFLRLRNGTWLHYVGRSHITRVIEIGAGAS